MRLYCFTELLLLEQWQWLMITWTYTYFIHQNMARNDCSKERLFLVQWPWQMAASNLYYRYISIWHEKQLISSWLFKVQWQWLMITFFSYIYFIFQVRLRNSWPSWFSGTVSKCVLILFQTKNHGDKWFLLSTTFRNSEWLMVVSCFYFCNTSRWQMVFPSDHLWSQQSEWLMAFVDWQSVKFSMTQDGRCLLLVGWVMFLVGMPKAFYLYDEIFFDVLLVMWYAPIIFLEGWCR